MQKGGEERVHYKKIKVDLLIIKAQARKREEAAVENMCQSMGK